TEKGLDACGHTSGTVSQPLTVRDTPPPTVCSSGAEATTESPTPSLLDALPICDTCSTVMVVEVSDVTTPGSCAGNYSRKKTWKTADARGDERRSAGQIVTVRDLTPTTTGAPGPDATIDCPASPVFTAPTASDTC